MMSMYQHVINRPDNRELCQLYDGHVSTCSKLINHQDFLSSYFRSGILFIPPGLPVQLLPFHMNKPDNRELCQLYDGGCSTCSKLRCLTYFPDNNIPHAYNGHVSTCSICLIYFPDNNIPMYVSL